MFISHLVINLQCAEFREDETATHVHKEATHRPSELAITGPTRAPHIPPTANIATAVDHIKLLNFECLLK